MVIAFHADIASSIGTKHILTLTKSMTPDREVITFIPEEFIVDGFQGIRDPRGMMGVRLEMRGLLYTGPRTILHNLRKTVERVGIHVDNVIISPLAIVNSVLNEGEREFGSVDRKSVV